MGCCGTISGAVSLAKVILTGGDATPEVIEKRLAVCKQCDKSKPFLTFTSCQNCKCVIEAKVRLIRQECPEKKWLSEIPVRKLRVFVQNYTSKNAKRQEELDYCYAANRHNADIDELVVLPDGPRPVFQDIFDHPLADGGEQWINVLTNSDIELNEIGKLKSMMMPNDFVALTRWQTPEKLHCGSDVWLWVGRCKIKGANFPLGVPDNDTAIVELAKAHGYAVKNPCRAVKTLHHHKSGHRTYSAKDKVKMS